MINMIDKKNLWFLTLFSLVLVLSVYYVTMPNELLVTNNGNVESTSEENEENEISVSITESDVISALKVEDENDTLEEINTLKETLTNTEETVDKKNEAYDKIKELNENSGKEETIENMLKEKYKYDAFVKIDGDQVRVVIGTKDHSTEFANEIMRLVQEQFNNKMYISVQFQA